MYQHKAFTGRLAARIAVMEYIGVWYNPQRPHTASGGLGPQAVQDRCQGKDSVAFAA